MKMILNFNSGVQLCVRGAWFNLFIHRWRGVWVRHVLIPIDCHEYTVSLGFFTLELESL